MVGARATRLYLVRHGEVDPAWRGRVYGDLDVPLSEDGKRQADEAAAALARTELAAVVSSDLERAKYGAERIAAAHPHALPHAIDARWREIARGAWAGASFEELERRTPGAFAAWLADPEHSRPPDGESLADLGRRVAPALEELCSAHPGAALAVVAHGWVLRVVLARVLGLSGAAISRLVLPPASIAALDWPEGARLPAPATAPAALARGAALPAAVGDRHGGGVRAPHRTAARPPRFRGLGLDVPPPR